MEWLYLYNYYSYIIITTLWYCLTISGGIAHRKGERTEMIYDMESAISYGIRFIQNVKERMDVLIDKNGPSMI